MHELLRAARDDPQGFKQRMRDLGASSGAAAFTLTPEGLVPLTGPGVPGAAGPTALGDAGSFGAASPGVTPAAWDPATFGVRATPTAPQPPPAAASSGGNPLDQLDKLAKLHSSGALTDAEFEAEKRRILGG
jgi:Short C-terminal domain